MFIDINTIDADGRDVDATVTLRGAAQEHADLHRDPEAAVVARIVPGPDRRAPAERATVRGTVRAELALNCSRCLEATTVACAVEFDLTVVGEPPEPEQADHKIDARETHYLEIENGRLDLEALAKEQIYLEIPAKPVCRPDCAGLCPTCGINRNRLECGCREEAVDPRLEALRAIRDKMGKPRG